MVNSAYMTEQQQIEQLKLWWKNNGVSTVIIFIVAILISVGLHLWLQHREIKLERASSHYEQLLNAVVNDNDADATKEADLLKQNYTNTPYAALATLMLARGDVYRNDYAGANAELRWVMQHASTNSLKQIARLRLARIALQQNAPQQSLDLLKKVDDPSYAVMIDEIKGDSYLALKQNGNARQAYQKALAALPGYATARPILQMKLNDLATPSTTGAAS